ncbi:MAG: PaeR7I family type II restriction endonuclease [Coriobacteriales bacterium]|nr:PaeR7I family type II restriction endonuclease [Coriobacteriales bacterium]
MLILSIQEKLPPKNRTNQEQQILDVVVHESRLIAAVELKTIWGSYRNNLNNRAEEAIGSATDLAKALQSGLLGSSFPWLGYVFIIKDDAAIHRTNRFREPHFPVDEVFRDATYLKRFEVLCSRLVTERLYDNVWYVCLNDDSGEYLEPNAGMTWSKFEAAIRGKVLEELA